MIYMMMHGDMLGYATGFIDEIVQAYQDDPWPHTKLQVWKGATHILTVAICLSERKKFQKEKLKEKLEQQIQYATAHPEQQPFYIEIKVMSQVVY